jgi:DNA-directed RNA polymerase subunit beta'
MAETLNKKKISKLYIGLASNDIYYDKEFSDSSVKNQEQKKFWGEVTEIETINYRTYTPEANGLFCQKIFGPITDFECYCGKYKKYKYKGLVCDKCGVEITTKDVRRERAGYIKLCIPVVHPWFAKSFNKIGILLDIDSKKLSKIINYEKYVVINPGKASEIGIKKLELLTDFDYWNIKKSLDEENDNLSDDHPDKFLAKMGGEAIHILLKNLDLDALEQNLIDETSLKKNLKNQQNVLKRLSLVKNFKKNNSYRNNKPEYMTTQIIYVLPPELRPIVQLEGGKFASSDVNELYKKVIVRNKRLYKLTTLGSPEIILRNEKRSLQEAIDNLIDKTNKGKVTNKTEYKSLTELLKGKSGLYRGNLLGKRVNYSGRFVITVGPNLKMHQCGIPKTLALELFKPFLIRRILDNQYVNTFKYAEKLIEKKHKIVWKILEDVIKGHPVLLNRAPTLHRLSIQAFQPVLVEGNSLQLHPLHCTPFNADFDGDQMGVHIPLSNEAIVESIILMLAPQNVFNPSNGKAIIIPSKDIVLGIYYITKRINKSSNLKKLIIFSNKDEVLIAYNCNKVDLHDVIKLRLNKKNSFEENSIIETTPGIVIFNNIIPDEMPFYNEVFNAKKLQQLISDIHENCGIKKTIKFLEDIKDLGFKYAFKSGLSIGLTDIKVPKNKSLLIEESKKKVDDVISYYISGIITNNEKDNNSKDIWTLLKLHISKSVEDILKNDQGGLNPLFCMYDSGARGSKEQLSQLSGMKGLVSKLQSAQNTSGYDITETPIFSSFKEGLDCFDYMMASNGSRKGLADTALKTSDSGYLTRRLVEIAQDVIIKIKDCGALIGSIENHVYINDEIVERISERISGRVSLMDVLDPKNGSIIVSKGDIITEKKAKIIDDLNITNIEVRSIFNCKAKNKGLCSKCYGVNLATGYLVSVGDAVGVIAAQSIGEPGTQLTLRTFHVGAVSTNIVTESNIVSKYNGKIEFVDLQTVLVEKSLKKDQQEVYINLSRFSEVKIIDDFGNIVFTKRIPYGSEIKVKNGDFIKKDQEICSWDPYNGLILADKSGIIKFSGLEEGISYIEEYNENSGLKFKIIIESKYKEITPSATLHLDDGKVITYNLPAKSILYAKDDQKLSAGEVICKIPRIIGKSRDITGGLPRVTELLEVRKGVNNAILSEIDGVAYYGECKKGFLEVFVVSTISNVKRKYILSLLNYVLVHPNDYVRAGDKLSEGYVSPSDLLEIKGVLYKQAYLVNELQEVYKLQGVKINDKHMEIIILQMMSRVKILDSGDTNFVIGDLVDKSLFQEKNEDTFDKYVILDKGDSSNFNEKDIVSYKEIFLENAILEKTNKKKILFRKAKCSIAKSKISGITKIALENSSPLSASSFQESSKVLSEAAIKGTIDNLDDMKGSIISGQLIPAGTGANLLKDYQKVEKVSAV